MEISLFSLKNIEYFNESYYYRIYDNVLLIKSENKYIKNISRDNQIYKFDLNDSEIEEFEKKIKLYEEYIKNMNNIFINKNKSIFKLEPLPDDLYINTLIVLQRQYAISSDKILTTFKANPCIILIILNNKKKLLAHIDSLTILSDNLFRDFRKNSIAYIFGGDEFQSKNIIYNVIDKLQKNNIYIYNIDLNINTIAIDNKGKLYEINYKQLLINNNHHIYMNILSLRHFKETLNKVE